ncbi:hypothetical protein SAM19_03623 [Brevibacillus laterosporus]|nr:hypothetical protein [Brevibacillus laterosporus]
MQMYVTAELSWLKLRRHYFTLKSKMLDYVQLFELTPYFSKKLVDGLEEILDIEWKKMLRRRN